MTKSSKSSGEESMSSQPLHSKTARDNASTTPQSSQQPAEPQIGLHTSSHRRSQPSVGQPNDNTPRRPQPVVPNAKSKLPQQDVDSAGNLSAGDDNDAPGAVQQATNRQSATQGAKQKKSSRIAQAARSVNMAKSDSADSLSSQGLEDVTLAGVSGVASVTPAGKAISGAVTKLSNSLESSEEDNAAKRTAKQVSRDGAKVAKGAIKGAVKGGLHGAATGAVTSLLKTKSFWVVITGILLIVSIGISLLGMMLMSLLAGDTDSAQESAARASVGQSTAEVVSDDYDGADSSERMMQRVAETTGADFYILSSILAEYEGADDGDPTSWFGLTDEAKDYLASSGIELENGQWSVEDEARYIGDLILDAKDEHFGPGASADLAQGYTLSVVSGGRQPIDGQEEVRQQVIDTWVEAVEALSIEDAEDNAPSIVDRARDWKVSKEEQVCTPVVNTASEDTAPATDISAPAQYQPLILQAAATSGVSSEILSAQLFHESGFDPTVTSPAGAMGIAQIMPDTWAAYGNWGDAYNPNDAIPAQGRYMKEMMEFVEDMAGGDTKEQIKLALAAYNAGPGNVQKYGGVPPFRETQNYVEKILNGVDATGFSVNCAAFSSGLTVEGIGADDYPYREPVGVKGWGFARTTFGHTQRECTDFVMWRVNQAMGWTPDSGQQPPFTFAKLGVSYGSGQRGAGSWVDILTQVDGMEFTKTPQPGDIAWWGYNDVGGGYGHVGFVAEVNGDQVTVEHYNYTNVSAYSVTVHTSSEIPGYIRISESHAA